MSSSDTATETAFRLSLRLRASPPVTVAAALADSGHSAQSGSPSQADDVHHVGYDSSLASHEPPGPTGESRAEAEPRTSVDNHDRIVVLVLLWLIVTRNS